MQIKKNVKEIEEKMGNQQIDFKPKPITATGHE